MNRPAKVYVDYFEVLKDSLRFYGTNFVLLILISLIANSAGIVSSVFTEDLLMQSPLLYIPAGVLGLVSLFLKAWGSVAVIIAVKKLAEGGLVTVGECFRMALSRILNYIGYFLITMMIILLGTLFFVIPGIYLSVIFTFTVIIAVLEPEETNPLSGSKKLVEGNFWGILLFYIFVMLIFLLIIIPVALSAGAVGAFIPYLKDLPMQLIIVAEEPLMLVISVMLYLKFREIKKGRKTVTDAGDMAGKLALGCVGGCLLLILVIGIGTAAAVGIGTKILTSEDGRAKLIRMFGPVIKRASDRVVFAGGIEMKVPDSSFSRRLNREMYEIMIFNPSGVMIYIAEKISGDSMENVKGGLLTDNKNLVKAVVNKKVKTDGPDRGIDFSKFKVKESESGEINGRKWMKVTLSQKRRLADKTELTYWDIYYTVYKGDIYTVDYTYPVFDLDEKGDVATAYKEKVALYTETGSQLVKDFGFGE